MYGSKRMFLIPLILLVRFTTNYATKDMDINKLEKFTEILDPKNLLEIYAVNEANFVNSSCQEDIMLYLRGIKLALSGNSDFIWALKMLDASTKVPSGILKGNFLDLGAFDECLSVSGTSESFEIRGRHCFYSLKLDSIPLSLKFSICLPSSCQAEDVIIIMKNVKQLINHKLGLDLSINDASCSSINKKSFSVGTVLTIIFLTIILSFLFICTLLQWLQRKLNLTCKCIDILGKFSVYNSTKKIFDTRLNPSSFPALYGIRTLSIFWIVYGHTFTSRVRNPYINTSDYPMWLTSWSSLHIFLAPFAVDTFFLISGFLMTYLFLNSMSKGGKFNIFLYYFHRYLRLTPVVVVLLIITIFLIPHMSSGPIWEKGLEQILTRTCEEKWWTIPLYIQNYVRTDIECLGHTWYLAVDMHYYLISPIILIPLTKKPKLGLYILGSLFVTSLLTVAILMIKNNYAATLVSQGISVELMMNSFRFFYTVSHTRASPWLLGIYLGYVIHSNHKKLSRTGAIYGWIGASVCFVFCILGQKVLLDENYVYNKSYEVFFGTLSRPLWAAGVAWIIFATINGYGGIVTKFLSLPIFFPLSRISYCIYIVHSTFQLVLVNSVRTVDYFSNFTMINHFMSELIMTLVLAFVFSICFESPIMIMEKLMFGREMKREANLNSRIEGVLNDDEC